MTFPFGERMIAMNFHDIQTGTPGSAWMYATKNLRTIPIFNFGGDSSTDCIEWQEGGEDF